MSEPRPMKKMIQNIENEQWKKAYPNSSYEIWMLEIFHVDTMVLRVEIGNHTFGFVQVDQRALRVYHDQDVETLKEIGFKTFWNEHGNGVIILEPTHVLFALPSEYARLGSYTDLPLFQYMKFHYQSTESSLEKTTDKDKKELVLRFRLENRYPLHLRYRYTIEQNGKTISFGKSLYHINSELLLEEKKQENVGVESLEELFKDAEGLRDYEYDLSSELRNYFKERGYAALQGTDYLQFNDGFDELSVTLVQCEFDGKCMVIACQSFNEVCIPISTGNFDDPSALYTIIFSRYKEFFQTARFRKRMGKK